MRRVRGWAWVVLVSFAPVNVAVAQEPPVIALITGETLNSDVKSISDAKVVGESTPPGLLLSEISVIRTGHALSTDRGALEIHLGGGGYLNASAAIFNGETITIDTPFGQFELPPESIRGIVFKPAEDRNLFQANLANPSGETDQVIAETSGGQQMVAGLLESINAEKLSLNYRGESRTISLSKIVGVVMADLKPEPLQGTVCRFRLVDGSTLSGNLMGLADGVVNVRVMGGKPLAIDWSQVNMITVRSDRLVYLSDLDPVSADQTPLATIAFPWRRDESVNGNPITLNYPEQGTRKTFDKGLGTHAAARLAFANDGDFNRLVATVGIDAETNGHGNCLVSVRADGIELWSAQLTGKSMPQELDIDISGMKQIELIVQPGEHLDLADHVDWANARFIKTGD